MPSITIVRDSGYVDRLRAYEVLIDRQRLGELRNGESKQFTISPGQHELMVKVDWCSSKPVNFTAVEGEDMAFYAKSNVRDKTGYAILWLILFHRDAYLVVERGRPPEAPSPNKELETNELETNA
jgi:hypothetical protein